MFPLYLSPFDWAQGYVLVEGDFVIRTTIFEMASRTNVGKKRKKFYRKLGGHFAFHFAKAD